jgi:hypothetical protein
VEDTLNDFNIEELYDLSLSEGTLEQLAKHGKTSKKKG